MLKLIKMLVIKKCSLRLILRPTCTIVFNLVGVKTDHH